MLEWKNSPIFEYYNAIKLGKVTVGNYIRKWYDHVIDGLKNDEFVYSEKAYNRAVTFIENFCHHHEGALAPALIKLELWQKAFVATVFGILDHEGFRQFRECVLIIGRKNGKTLLLSALSAYMLIADGEYGSRVFFCAPKLDQARLCYEALYQSIKQEEQLSSIVKKRRTDIYCTLNNATAQPIAFSAKKSDGLNLHMGVCDEIAAWQGDAGIKQYEVLKSSMGSRKQPLLCSISTASYFDMGAYDELIKRSTAVINGTSKEKRLAPFLYIIDDVSKWNDINELKKSNPNLNVSVSQAYLLEEIAVAESSNAKLQEFLCKYCNVKSNSAVAWFDAQTVRKAFGNNYTLEDFRSSYALGGLDLSSCGDLSSACVLVQKQGVIYCFSHFWMPSEKLNEATSRDGIAYQALIDRGFLSLSGDNYIDYHDIFNWFVSLVRDQEIYCLKIGYDRYSAQYVVQDLQEYGFQMESVFQGFNLSGIEDNLEMLLKDGKFKCADDNDLLKIHFIDCAQKLESNSSIHPRKKLQKISKNAHVDGVAAILDALCMRQNHWAEYGDRLKNEV